MMNELIALYPTSTIWLVGHSLGGALASLLGSTFGFPAVAFESPGELLAAQRLHLPLPPSSILDDEEAETTSHLLPRSAPVAVTHVYHNADPIPLGTCTGLRSPCERAGYALQTKCHLGKSIVYDTVARLGWKEDIRRHPIRVLVHKVLEITNVVWEFGKEVGEVPKARPEVDCVECKEWEFGEFGKV
jgi:lipase ATG15